MRRFVDRLIASSELDDIFALAIPQRGSLSRGVNIRWLMMRRVMIVRITEPQLLWGVCLPLESIDGVPGETYQLREHGSDVVSRATNP
jgi:hypothetical protein